MQFYSIIFYMLFYSIIFICYFILLYFILLYFFYLYMLFYCISFTFDCFILIQTFHPWASSSYSVVMISDYFFFNAQWALNSDLYIYLCISCLSVNNNSVQFLCISYKIFRLFTILPKLMWWPCFRVIYYDLGCKKVTTLSSCDDPVSRVIYDPRYEKITSTVIYDPKYEKVTTLNSLDDPVPRVII